MNENESSFEDNDLDDLLEEQWEMQDKINPKCKMREKEKRKKYS